MIVTMLEWMDACLNIPCTAPSNVSVEFAWDTIQQIVAHDYLDNNIYNILVLTLIAIRIATPILMIIQYSILMMKDDFTRPIIIFF